MDTRRNQMTKQTNTTLSAPAEAILAERYAQRDDDGNIVETPKDVFTRVATSVAAAERTESDRQRYGDDFFDVMMTGKFLPNSPTIVNAGVEAAGGAGCLSACFVLSPEDDMQSIMDVASDAAMIEKWGGGVGFGFSQLRPRKDKIKTTHGQACGPVAVMRLYSQVGATLTQGSFRLGAHMGQLSVSHPDVREFIHCKDGDDTLSNFNISVQLTNDFMTAVLMDADYNLVNPRNDDVVETISAKELWREICESAWKTGDPGVVFMDRVLETQPNPQMGDIQTSNPCAEQFLEEYGNCCLGSINLDLHCDAGAGRIDFRALEATVRLTVRFLDDVIEINTFPLERLRDVNLATRRIGLGVMGWADALSKLNVPYDSSEAISLAEETSLFIERIAWDESARLAEERGAYPEYENSALKRARDAEGLPAVRHSAVTTVAPTGTISRLAGCSSGIEPYFALAWKSNVLWSDQETAELKVMDAPRSILDALVRANGGDERAAREALKPVYKAGPDAVAGFVKSLGLDPGAFRTAMEIEPTAHVDMQAAWQKGISNGVSKTVNLSNEATVEDVEEVFLRAWRTNCKAVTIYRDGSKDLQVLETSSSSKEGEDEPAPQYRVTRDRPDSLVGVSKRMSTGHGNMYVTVNADPETNAPFEVFTVLGKAGGCDNANLEAISRLTTLALRSGINPEEIVEQLRNITCCPSWDNGRTINSAPDAMASVLALYTSGVIPGGVPETPQEDVAYQPKLGPVAGGMDLPGEPLGFGGYGSRCRDCGSTDLVPQDGCMTCSACGYSKC